MWGDKKPDPSSKSPLPQQPQQTQEVRPSISSTNAPAFAGEAKTMAPIDSTNPNTSASSGNSARLGSSLHVKGEITGNEDLLIDGSVEGLVQLEDRKLTVGASAKVTADVIAREVVIYGNVKGNLRARDRIEIKKDGSVVGDLTTARISIEDGAYFKGSIEIDKAGEGSNADKGSFARASRTTAATTTS
jgi:cytoskeletal protein CcmA (bactofilin family)